MPFTGSHPAAVLPFVRSGLVPSALVIGSMVPDLPYFLPTAISATTTHTPAGALTVDVLLGGVAFGVWQSVLAPFAIAIAPAALRDRIDSRLPRGLTFHVRNPLRATVLAVSLAFGAATHVLWDSFTHLERWGPRHIGWLTEVHAGIPGYRWAQYVSGLVGGAALVVWFAHWWYARTPRPRTDPRTAPLPRPVAYAIWGLIGLATVVGGLLGARLHLPEGGLYVTAFQAATKGGGAGLLAALACAVCWLVRPRSQDLTGPLPPSR